MAEENHLHDEPCFVISVAARMWGFTRKHCAIMSGPG